MQVRPNLFPDLPGVRVRPERRLKLGGQGCPSVRKIGQCQERHAQKPPDFARLRAGLLVARCSLQDSVSIQDKPETFYHASALLMRGKAAVRGRASMSSVFVSSCGHNRVSQLLLLRKVASFPCRKARGGLSFDLLSTNRWRTFSR